MVFDSLMTGADEPCPNCRSAEVRLAKANERPRCFGGTLKAYRECESCGHVFEPISPTSHAVGVILLAVAMLACGVGLLFGSSLFHGLRLGTVVRYLVSLLVICGGLTLITPAVRGFRLARRAKQKSYYPGH